MSSVNFHGIRGQVWCSSFGAKYVVTLALARYSDFFGKHTPTIILFGCPLSNNPDAISKDLIFYLQDFGFYLIHITESEGIICKLMLAYHILFTHFIYVKKSQVENSRSMFWKPSTTMENRNGDSWPPCISLWDRNACLLPFLRTQRCTPLPTLSLYQDQTRPPPQPREPTTHNNKIKKKNCLSPFNIQLTNSHSLWFCSFYMLILYKTSFSLCPIWELTD